VAADDSPLLRSLMSAVEKTPGDVPLRVHLARLLLDDGRATDALRHCSHALQLAPGDADATELLTLITRGLVESAEPALPSEPAPDPTAMPPPDTPIAGDRGPMPADGEFDWDSAERQFPTDDPILSSEPGADQRRSGPVPPDRDSAPNPATGVERPSVRLADVGGMEEVKRALQASFLVPMANPELRAAYGATINGGLLLYGPPGCGKTFIARALAGELGASFIAVSLADVLDMWLGQSERNLRALFDTARGQRPSIIFLDEVDALGQKRTHLRSNPAMRGTVNQLLYEMDGAIGNNDGVFVLGATNQPWDVDSALRRPGRFDRTVFVAPPDLPARRAILRFHLADRPVGAIDFERLGADTSGYSGADLAQLCNVATQSAMAEAARTGIVRPIEMSDLEQARRQVRPSTGEWFAGAKQAATFANQDGTYDDLVAYLKSARLW
jgi:AAA+ superfamily predicted ATPase